MNPELLHYAGESIGRHGTIMGLLMAGTAAVLIIAFLTWTELRQVPALIVCGIFATATCGVLLLFPGSSQTVLITASLIEATWLLARFTRPKRTKVQHERRSLSK